MGLWAVELMQLQCGFCSRRTHEYVSQQAILHVETPFVRHPIFPLLNDRSILKPRHEDAALFQDDSTETDLKDSESHQKSSKKQSRFSIENEDGAITVDRDWEDMGDITDSLGDWNWEEERTLGKYV